MMVRLNHHYDQYNEGAELIEQARVHGFESPEIRNAALFLDAYGAEIDACYEAAEGDLAAEWEPDDYTWRITYEVDSREVVYRWFERLGRLDVVEPCMTFTTYDEWEEVR